VEAREKHACPRNGNSLTIHRGRSLLYHEIRVTRFDGGCRAGHRKGGRGMTIPCSALAGVLLVAVTTCFSCAEEIAPDFAQLRNPVWATADNLRDPSVLKTPDGYRLYYSRLAGKAAKSPGTWTVAEAVTKDFVHFAGDHDVSAKGYASPGDVVSWHGRYLLPYQTYPSTPTQLCFSESADLRAWSAPKTFLPEARLLPWNTQQRVIDPTLVVVGDTLHCFFIGSTNVTDGAGKTLRANLLGHAITHDPKLEHWEILTPDAPILGVSASAPDGVENVAIFRTEKEWVMIYSEGLVNQHLALAVSADLRAWQPQGPLELPRQKWMARKYGAPFVWRESGQWLMILMGEDAAGKTTFGLLTSPDGKQWTLLPEQGGSSQER